MKEYWDFVAPYLTDDHMFACGVEFGVLHEKLSFIEMQDTAAVMQVPIHRENQDRLCVLAGKLGFKIEEMNPIDDIWMSVILSRESTNAGDDLHA